MGGNLIPVDITPQSVSTGGRVIILKHQLSNKRIDNKFERYWKKEVAEGLLH